MFYVVGKIDGIQCTLKYENGILSGDDIAIQKALEENKKEHGNLGMPPSTKSNYLADSNAAYFLITGIVFDEIIEVNPKYTIPEGADA